MIIRHEITEIIRLAESSDEGESNFIPSLNAIRERVVYDAKAMTNEDFDDICRDIISEREDT